MDNASSGYNPGTMEEFVWKNEIKEEEFISLPKNEFPENNFHEEIVELKHSPIKDWNSLCWTCYYCSTGFNDFANLKAHQESLHEIFTWADTNFECFDCKDVFMGYSTFLNHIRSCHYEALKLCCDVCNELLLDYEQLSRHRDKHNEMFNQIHPTVYHCTLCVEVHSTEKLLKLHLQESHCLKSTDKTYENKLLSYENDEERYETEENGSVSIESIKCEEEYGETEQILQCGKYVENISSEIDLKARMHSPTDDSSRKCKVCGKQFASKSNLNFHMKTHSDERPFKCDICSKDFKVKSTLKGHMQTHTGERPFKCEMCCKMFYKKYKLKVHICTLTADIYIKCNICGKQFSKKSNLTHHMITHTNTGPFKCDTCSKEFKIKKSFKDHMRKHTIERTFKCDTCSKAFTRKDHLERHIMIHKKETPFKCDICSKMLKRKDDLEKHMGIHNNERPFKCDTCSKAFTLESNLKRHMGTHTNERPFKCDACSMGFKLKQHLKAHRRLCKGLNIFVDKKS